MQQELASMQEKYMRGEWGLVGKVTYNGPCREYADPDQFAKYLATILSFPVEVKWYSELNQAFVYIPRLSLAEEVDKAFEDVSERFINLLDCELIRLEQEIRSALRRRVLTPDGLQLEFTPNPFVMSGFQAEDHELVRRLLSPIVDIHTLITSDDVKMQIHLTPKYA